MCIYNGCAPQGVLMQSVLGATATTSSQGALAFTIPAGGQVTIVLAAVTDRNNTNYFAAAQQQAQPATTASLSNLFLAHGAWWSNFWSKSFVQIPEPKDPGQLVWVAVPAGVLQQLELPAAGPAGEISSPAATPGWQGDYTLDYNYEASPWAAHGLQPSGIGGELLTSRCWTRCRAAQATAQYLYGMTNAILFLLPPDSRAGLER